MRTRLATILLAGIALVAPAAAGASQTHVLRYKAVGGAGHLITRVRYYYDQTLYSRGRRVGRIHAVCTAERGFSACNLAVHLRGGALRAHWHVTGYYVKGTVTGGTGRFRGARGHIVQDERGEPTYPDGSGIARITITLQRV
jgi:hypothetical protein